MEVGEISFEFYLYTSLFVLLCFVYSMVHLTFFANCGIAKKETAARGARAKRPFKTHVFHSLPYTGVVLMDCFELLVVDGERTSLHDVHVPHY